MESESRMWLQCQDKEHAGIAAGATWQGLVSTSRQHNQRDPVVLMKRPIQPQLQPPQPRPLQQLQPQQLQKHQHVHAVLKEQLVLWAVKNLRQENTLGSWRSTLVRPVVQIQADARQHLCLPIGRSLRRTASPRADPTPRTNSPLYSGSLTCQAPQIATMEKGKM